MLELEKDVNLTRGRWMKWEKEKLIHQEVMDELRNIQTNANSLTKLINKQGNKQSKARENFNNIGLEKPIQLNVDS